MLDLGILRYRLCGLYSHFFVTILDFFSVVIFIPHTQMTTKFYIFCNINIYRASSLSLHLLLTPQFSHPEFCSISVILFLPISNSLPTHHQNKPPTPEI